MVATENSHGGLWKRLRRKEGEMEVYVSLEERCVTTETDVPE